MECGFSVSSSDPLQGTPRLADLLRAEIMALSFPKEKALQDVTFQLTLGSPDSVTTVDMDTCQIDDETALVFFLDLQDYGLESDSFELESLALAVTTYQRPVIGLVMRNLSRFVKQTKASGSPLGGVRATRDATKAIAHITTVLKNHIKVEDWDFSFIFNEKEDVHPNETFVRLQEIISGMTVRTRPLSDD
jgi:hypothetical protein